MYLSVIVYFLFAFYFGLIAIIIGSFTMFNKVASKVGFWNKKQSLILLTIIVMNLPLQLTTLILAITSKTYNFSISDTLSSDDKFAISLLTINFALLIFTVVYCILVSDYLAVKFTKQFVFLFGRKIRIEKIYEINENENDYLTVRFVEGSRAKRKISWNKKSLTTKFILENYQDYIHKVMNLEENNLTNKKPLKTVRSKKEK